MILNNKNLLVPGSLELPTQKIQNQSHIRNQNEHNILNIPGHREREENKMKNNSSTFFNEIWKSNVAVTSSSSPSTMIDVNTKK